MVRLAAVLMLLAVPAHAADPVALDVGGQAHPLGAALQAAAPVAVSLGAARYAGPLLWDVLGRAGVIDAGNARKLAGETVLVTGADGYTAAIAAGELAPVFAGRQVILATTKDGATLGDGHLRLVVGGDAKAGRSIRDVARIAVRAP